MAKEGQDRQENRQSGTRQGEGSSGAMQTTGRRGGERRTDVARRGSFDPSRWTGSPFSLMRRLSEEMDRVFEDFGVGRGFPSSRREIGRLGERLWSPQVEVFEKNNRLMVRADLPGMNKDDIDVEFTEGSLVIQGERHSEREEDDEGYYRSERTYGSFYREIPLPEGVNGDDAEATFRNGVLEISMPMPEKREEQRRRIHIREESEEREHESTGRR